MESRTADLRYSFGLFPGDRYYPTVATCVILFLNILIFILMTLAGGSHNINVLLEFGASYGPYFRAGEYWRLVMPMFLHIGWAHLAVNMFALYLLGSFLEPLYGYGRFAVLYVVSGMGGSLVSMEASSHIAAGSSGAIFGVAGAMLVTGLLHPQTVPPRWKNVFGFGILSVIVANLTFGHFIRHIDNWAHLGGLVTGLFLAWVMPPARLQSQTALFNRRSIQPVLALPVAVVVIAIGATANHYFKLQQVARLVQTGARLEAVHQTDRARVVLEEAERLAPSYLPVHEGLGMIYLETREYPRAIEEFEQALRFNPASPQDTLRLATAYEGSGNLAKAREVLESAQKSVPRDLAIKEALAEVETNLKLYPDAIQQYENILKAAPNFALAQNNLAWLLATCDNRRYRDPHTALEYALRAVKLTGWRSADFIDTLAAALYANGQFKLAAEVEAKAAQLAPQNQTFQYNLARYRQAAGFKL